jgi:hypothetical protein
MRKATRAADGDGLDRELRRDGGGRALLRMGELGVGVKQMAQLDGARELALDPGQQQPE